MTRLPVRGSPIWSRSQAKHEIGACSEDVPALQLGTFYKHDTGSPCLCNCCRACDRGAPRDGATSTTSYEGKRQGYPWSTAVASGAPLRTLPNLLSVTIHETTFGTVANTNDPNAAQIITRLPDPLSGTNTDFTSFPDEYYDAFNSDSSGASDVDGACLTVEGVWRNQSLLDGGMNVAEVQLTFTGPTNDFGDFVASFVHGELLRPRPGSDRV